MRPHGAGPRTRPPPHAAVPGMAPSLPGTKPVVAEAVSWWEGISLQPPDHSSADARGQFAAATLPTPRAGRVRKAAFIGYPEKPTPGLAKSTASLGRRRRSPEDLLLTRFSSAGGYQPAKCHALAKVLLPHRGADAGGRPPARSKRKGGRGSPGAPGHLLASPGSFPGSIRDTGTRRAKALPPPQGQVGLCPACQQPARCGDQAGASGSPSAHRWAS